MEQRRSVNGILIILIVYSVAWQSHAAVVCTSAGRYADPADPTCKNYTFCVYDGSSFQAFNYTCPTISIFNPNTAQCTAPTNYNCTGNPASVCTAEGFIPDPSSTDCTSYIGCVDLNNGTFLETSFECLVSGTFFDPSTADCVVDYVCPGSTFACAASGRFADASDRTCQRYFFCVLAPSGTFVQYNYTCPTISVFSPTSRVCTTSYICPN